MATKTDPEYLQVNDYMSNLLATQTTFDYIGSKGYIYSHMGGRAEVDHTFNSFVTAALNLLGLNESDDWAFMVDQYDNAPIHRHKSYRKWWNVGLSWSTTITKDDQATWKEIVLPRVMNRNQNWMMAVSPYRADIGKVTPYLFPAKSDGVGNIVKPQPFKQIPNPVAGTNGSGQTGSSTTNHEQIIDNGKELRGGQPTLKTAITFKPVSSKLFPKGTIYGYSGHVFVSNNANSIRDGALQLLDLHHSEEWEFMIDIRARDDQHFIHHLKVARANFHTIFRGHILPLTSERTWSMFVRTSYFHPSRWEPSDDTQHIIRLVNERGVGYWKIPKASQILTQNYCINQPQEDFQRAMRMLFPRNRPLPKGAISISNATKSVDIGFGTIELTRNLWVMVIQDIRDAAGTSGHITYDVQLRLLDKIFQPDTVGVKLIGSHYFGLCERGDFKSMMRDFITTLSDRDLASRQHPAEFKIWKTAALCDSDDDYAVLKYGEGDKEVAALKTWFESGSAATNCVHFRPEWATIVLIDVMDRNRNVAWDVESAHTLADFKKALNLLFRTAPKSPEQRKPVATRRYLLLEPQSDQSFVVSENTTEDEWRKYVYNWLHSSRIYILHGGGDEYELERQTLWGVSEKGLPTRMPSEFQSLPYNVQHVNVNGGTNQGVNPGVIPIKQVPDVLSPVQPGSPRFYGNQDGDEKFLEEQWHWEPSEDRVHHESPDVGNLPTHIPKSQQLYTAQLLDELHAQFLEQIAFCPRCYLHLPSCTQNQIAQHNIVCAAIPTHEETSGAQFPGATTTNPISGRFRRTAIQYLPFRQDHRVTKTTRADQTRRGAVSNGNVRLRLGRTYPTSGPGGGGCLLTHTYTGRFEPMTPRQPTNEVGVRARPERGDQRGSSQEETSRLWGALFEKLDRELERFNSSGSTGVNGLDQQNSRHEQPHARQATVDPISPVEVGRKGG